MNRNKTYTAIFATAAIGLTGCTAPKPASMGVLAANSSSVPANQQYLQAAVHVSVSNSSGTVIYSDATPNSQLILQAGQSYNLNLSVSGAPAGTTYQLVATNIDVIGGSSQTISLVAGENSIVAPAMADYAWSVVASATGYVSQTKFYQAQVTCSSVDTFTAASLNASSIVVSSSGNNLYNYSVGAGLTSGANGIGPYQCAWDPSGTGIIDTAYEDCTTALSSFYVNYVGTRNVGLTVKDSCNVAYTITQPSQLAYTVPTFPGNVFIYGQTSGATGTAAGDSRIDGVTYLATNTANDKIVSSQYGSGSFTLFAWQNYNMGSSVKFGMQIKIGGLVETTPIDAATGTGAISAAGATISSVDYVTDQAGDVNPSVSLSGSNCTLTNQGADVQFITGQPCSGGTAGDQNSATVEVYGDYSCTGLSDAGGTVNITGSFDGYFDIADSCSGGGQGGGGVAPPGF